MSFFSTVETDIQLFFSDVWTFLKPFAMELMSAEGSVIMTSALKEVNAVAANPSILTTADGRTNAINNITNNITSQGINVAAPIVSAALEVAITHATTAAANASAATTPTVASTAASVAATAVAAVTTNS